MRFAILHTCQWKIQLWVVMSAHPNAPLCIFVLFNHWTDLTKCPLCPGDSSFNFITKYLSARCQVSLILSLHCSQARFLSSPFHSFFCRSVYKIHDAHLVRAVIFEGTGQEVCRCKTAVPRVTLKEGRFKRLHSCQRLSAKLLTDRAADPSIVTEVEKSQVHVPVLVHYNLVCSGRSNR